MIRVLIADDQPLVRLGLKVLIETEDDLELVGEAENGLAALELVRRTRPDVLLLDIRMPGLDGLAALREITADPALATTRVVMVTTFELDEYVFEALRNGASGFVLKDAEPADLLRAVRVVAAGESLLSPTVTRRVIEAFARRPAAPASVDLRGLTSREREVMGLVGLGLSNDEIAARLVISPATARTHVSRVMVKLAARDRAQLAVLANQAGLAG
ncbi:response regulator containing a CheY-like receiver domain and an HTH DNA-binding domain [Frankia sp. EI5c]|uniref:response regulator n=1 Tax=Frankia sp. EI5c TaxID=683316 RepID=UPI0007C21028|nr:response regulator transcription factor [Frankia sp. EI5c]OAA25631.1 response regulator containing a CheY-like receiver domain and an HTH DNA-binding domain [Frankia sp. EI5c]